MRHGALQIGSLARLLARLPAAALIVLGGFTNTL